MKLEAVTIFPEYFDSLKLSLLGKAQVAGLIEITIHDLRAFADGNHKSVDDTPYGGGAGMVMKPEVWGAALDPILSSESELIILTPAGKKFNQAMAQELSTAEQIVFACGRYEGIDARVADYYRAKGLSVREVSIGDYVLGGGEVAAMVIIEAITRLIPGVLGNPESLSEESHNEDGFLEYPNYTKPASWRGIEVPDVLLSGNHGEIAKWRATQAKKRAQENQ
jgi:tRNA (guanine37-N1)-methyltransferase